MDLVFNGKTGRAPAPDSIEFTVLCACASVDAWRELRRLNPGDFETAIRTLQSMGWGFEWATLQ